MSAQAPIVTIIGGSGFVGRHIAQRMARRGWRVRVACRRPNEAMYVKPYGTVGQVDKLAPHIGEGFVDRPGLIIIEQVRFILRHPMGEFMCHHIIG